MDTSSLNLDGCGVEVAGIGVAGDSEQLMTEIVNNQTNTSKTLGFMMGNIRHRFAQPNTKIGG
jgi:hypothetical protein